MDGPVSDIVFREIQEYLVQWRASKVIVGMALGTDIIAARAALSMDIPVIAAIPFKGQELKWKKKSQILYHKILDSPFVTTFVVCDGYYAPWKMQKRNEWMVDNSDKMISVWNGIKEGGTWNCIQYSDLKAKPRMNIDPMEILQTLK